MLISDYITPVMYVDLEGELPVLALFVTSLFVLTTYALIKESHPIIDPIIKNINFSVSSGFGYGYDVGESSGISYASGQEGFTCDYNGCNKITSVKSFSFLIYQNSSYYLNGVLFKEKQWGFLGFNYKKSESVNSFVYSLGGSAQIDPVTTGSMVLKIDIMGIVKDYWKLLSGDNSE